MISKKLFISESLLTDIRENAKKIAIAIASPAWEERDFSSVDINSNGTLTVEFSSSYRGDTEYHWVDLTVEDMNEDVDVTVAKYKAIKEAETKAYEAREAERQLKIQKEKEDLDRALYLKLKDKFKDV